MALSPSCSLRRQYDPAQALARHPPVLRHPHKRLVFSLACAPGATHAGAVELTRWTAPWLPELVSAAPLVVDAVARIYDYRGPAAAVWHVNFADPDLFMGYGSSLLAQDELQALEHPLLGSLREALLAAGEPALTEEDGQPTPVLVAGVERRCVLELSPDAAAGRPDGLYGSRFSAASAEAVRGAVRLLTPPTSSNLIAIAAPSGGRGPYTRAQLAQVLRTAWAGFSAAVFESRRLWPGSPVEVRTGFWGCGAFGGNRQVMAMLQLLAARLALLDKLTFYAVDARGLADFQAAQAQLEQVLGAGAGAEPLAAVLGRVEQLGHRWGVSDGT